MHHTCAQHIGDNGRDRHTGDTKLQRNDEKQVEDDIHRAGEQQIVHGTAAVAVAAQYGRAEIVHDHERNAQKIDEYVKQRLVQHAFRRAGEHEDGLCRQPADNHQSYAERRAEREHGVKRAVDLSSRLFCPMSSASTAFGPTDRPTIRLTENADERDAAAHCRKRGIACKAADDCDVCGVEKAAVKCC